MNERQTIRLMLLQTGCLEQLGREKTPRFRKPVYKKRNCLFCKKEFPSDGNRLCNTCHIRNSYITEKGFIESRSEKWFKKRRKNAQYT